MKHELKSLEIVRYAVIGDEAHAFCTCGWLAQAYDSIGTPSAVRAINMLIEHATREAE